MAAKGGPVEQVRVGDCVELLATAARTRATTPRHLNSPLFYQLLRAHGDLGPDAPAAIEIFSGRGQPSCEQLIDRYRIACRPVAARTSGGWPARSCSIHVRGPVAGSTRARSPRRRGARRARLDPGRPGVEHVCLELWAQSYVDRPREAAAAPFAPAWSVRSTAAA